MKTIFQRSIKGLFYDRPFNLDQKYKKNPIAFGENGYYTELYWFQERGGTKVFTTK